MAKWIDLFSLVLTITLFLGAIVGIVLFVRRISEFVNATKASLQEKGWTVSNQGVSVRTSKRLDREDYIDATQRGIMKVVGASKFGHAASASTTSLDGEGHANADGSSNKNGGTERKKRSLLRRNKAK